MIWPRWWTMSKRKLHAIAEAGRTRPPKSIVPAHRSSGSARQRSPMPALCASYAARTSAIVAGIGSGVQPKRPVSSASTMSRSSPTICQAISCAVRDRGSGR